MKKSSKIILTIIFSTIISLILAEGALRLLPGLVRPDKRMVYVHNKEGFRDMDHEIKALPGVLRIACIGDSYTRGVGVGFNQTFAALTPKMLAEKIQARVEGFNFGKSGANVLRELSILKESVRKYNPDIMVLAFVPNDFASREATLAFNDYYQKEELKFQYFKPLESFSYLARFMDMALFQLFSRARQAHLRWLNDSVSPERNPDFSEMLAALNELIGLIAEKRAVVLYFPYFLAANERQLDYYQYQFSLLRKVCSQKNCALIEVAELLQDKDYRSWWVSRANHHPNAAAHARVAEKLSELLAAGISARMRKP